MFAGLESSAHGVIATDGLGGAAQISAAAAVKGATLADNIDRLDRAAGKLQPGKHSRTSDGHKRFKQQE